MTFEDAKEFALMQEPTFLQQLPSKGGRHSYVCPCCNNGAGNSHTGILLIPKTAKNHPYYHCFKCGDTSDVFDLAKEYYHLSDMKDVFKYVYNFYGIEVDGNEVLTQEQQNRINQLKENMTRIADQEPEEEIDRFEYIKQAHENVDYSYLEKRGISKETQNHYMVGTDKHWRNPALIAKWEKEGKSTSWIKETPRCIIPTSRFSYLARDTRDNVPETESSYTKQKVGNARLFNEKLASKKDVVFVTEGEIDGMSIYEASKGEGEPVGLGSVSNWCQFVMKCEPGGPFSNKVFVLALDNDKAGLETTEKIETTFASMNVPSIRLAYNGKDPNNALEDDRGAFSLAVFRSLVKAETMFRSLVKERDKEEVKADMEQSEEVDELGL